MNASNTQIISESIYNYLLETPVEERTIKQQEQIETYQAANGFNLDAEEQASDTSVTTIDTPVEEGDTSTPVVFQDAANDDSDAPKAFADTVELDDLIADQMQNSLKVLDDQLTIADPRINTFLALAAKATCLAKWTGTFSLDVRVGSEPFAYQVANTLGLLSFKHYVADSVLSKDIKEKQLLSKYLTICSVPKNVKRDSAVSGYENVKKGCQFVVHTEAMKYVHNDDLNIAKLENVFSTEQIVEESYNESTIAILRVRLAQQEWVEANKERIALLVTDLHAQHKTIAPKVKAETFKTWSGILLLAALWNKAVYAEMVALMNEQVGTQGLEPKEKLACALSVVVPEYEELVNRFKSESHITTKLVGNLVKGLGLTDYEVSQGFYDLGIPMKDNRSGYSLDTLKAKFTEVIKYDNTSIQAYSTKLQKPVEAKAA